jgi:type II secretory pathway pseudopilin PulG
MAFMARATMYATSGSRRRLGAQAAKALTRFGRGLTLVETLVVVAVIIILAGAVISLTRHVDNQAKQRVLSNTFALLKGALREYCEVMDTFPVQGEPNSVLVAADPGLVQVIHAEKLYSQLASVPQSREVLRRIDLSLILSRKDPNDPEGRRMIERIGDSWRMSIDYRYTAAYKDKDGNNKEGDAFPTLISAGPDKKFGTADDINSRNQ